MSAPSRLPRRRALRVLGSPPRPDLCAARSRRIWAQPAPLRIGVIASVANEATEIAIAQARDDEGDQCKAGGIRRLGHASMSRSRMVPSRPISSSTSPSWTFSTAAAAINLQPIAYGLFDRPWACFQEGEAR